MKRVISMTLMLLVVASLFGCTYANSVAPTAEDIRESDLIAKSNPGADNQVVNPSAEPTENTSEDIENENRNTDDVTLGDYETDEKITYENDQYGFDFQLPVSWKGYTLVTENWNGSEVASGDRKETGPILYIRHPEWKQDDQRQDIPIMIFTLSQWDAVQNEELSVSAAPIPPSELGRNSAYVFALPARYNYAFPTGYEEVEDILSGKPLTPTENIKQPF